MKINKEKVGNIILSILIGIIFVIFIFSTFVVLSKSLQTILEVDLEKMWAFGAIFGFFFVTFCENILKPITIRIISIFTKRTDNI